jgi:hypothetical protein
MSLRLDWRHDGRRIILPVTILRPTPATDLTGFEGRALLDTGATISGIAPRVVRHLSLDARGKRRWDRPDRTSRRSVISSASR